MIDNVHILTSEKLETCLIPIALTNQWKSVMRSGRGIERVFMCITVNSKRLQYDINQKSAQ